VLKSNILNCVLPDEEVANEGKNMTAGFGMGVPTQADILP
jgi:hypothetical protein